MGSVGLKHIRVQHRQQESGQAHMDRSEKARTMSGLAPGPVPTAAGFSATFYFDAPSDAVTVSAGAAHIFESSRPLTRTAVPPSRPQHSREQPRLSSYGVTAAGPARPDGSPTVMRADPSSYAWCGAAVARAARPYGRMARPPRARPSP
jgi:hypothetical protein